MKNKTKHMPGVTHVAFRRQLVWRSRSFLKILDQRAIKSARLGASIYLRVFHSSSSSKQSFLLIQSKRIIHSIQSNHPNQTSHVVWFQFHVSNDVNT